MICRFAVTLTLYFAFSIHAGAQQWATKMFATTSHDFGYVAAGAKAEFAFELQNVYQEDVHIASVRSSCGCTSARILKDTLKTWEKSAIVATFNTHAFRGQRSATVTVVFDRPYRAEVQMQVAGFIRGDLLFEPGEVSFGDVETIESAERHVKIQFHGRSDWRILDVRSANQHFEVELTEPSRGNGFVAYDMVVRLKKEFPTGHFQDLLSLIASDNPGRAVTLIVQGNVLAPVSVSPASLFLGILEPGQSVTKNLVVKGKQPFRVECIDCDDGEELEFKAPQPDELKSLHVIPVTFTAGHIPGQYSQRITIKTSAGGGLECSCLAIATIRERAGK